MQSITRCTVGEKMGSFWFLLTIKINTCDKMILTTNLCITTVGGEQRIATCQIGDTGNVT